MRIFLMEVPIGIETSIPVLGPGLLTGAFELLASYRELGRVVSESGATMMSDFTLGAIGRWGFGIRILDGLRAFLLAELSAGMPIHGERSYPSGEMESYDRWPLGMGVSAVFELSAGLAYARAMGRVSRLGEARFSSSDNSLGVEGAFTTEVRLGIELGVHL